MEVVSKQFASHDRFADPSVPVVCQACAWAFREPHWRTSPVVCSGETVTGDDWGAVRHVLSSALPHSVAVSVPVRGQKHVLPWARWGCVSTDVHTIAWDGESARVFTDVLCVLDAGVRVADVLNPDAAVVLPDAVLVGAGAVMPEWMRVRSWRGAPIVQVAARTWQRTSRERTTEVTRDE